MKLNYRVKQKSFILSLIVLSFSSFAQSQNNDFLIGVFEGASLSTDFVAVPADYNNDGYADISVKTSGGYWLIDYADPYGPNNGFGSWDKVYAEYGGFDAIPVPGDYDGDGKTDLAVKTNTGGWLIDYAHNGLGGWDTPFLPGMYGGIDSHPVPGDYDGDGKTDISVKTDNGEWLIDLANNGFGSWDLTFYQYGQSDARPVPADYDGDGKTDLAVKTDSGGWLIDYAWNGFGGWDVLVHNGWLASAVPVPADYDGDGKVDIAVKDGQKWKIDYAIDGFGNYIQEYDQYGDETAEPVPADYDGDSKADLSVKLSTNGTWLIDYTLVNGINGWNNGFNLGNYTDYKHLLGTLMPYYYSDFSKLKKIKDANVDFIVAPELLYTYNNYAKIYSYLELAKQNSLKVLLSGYQIASYQNPDGLPEYKDELLSRFKNNLPVGLNEAIMGFSLGDEPGFDKYDNVNKWTNYFKANFPEKATYYNLLPRYWSEVNNDTEYENYLDMYINDNETDFVSFDHYPIKENEPFKTDFFYNMKVFKEKLGAYKPFWFVVQSHNGRFGNFTPQPYEPKLKFITSSAIAYGAKGLVYWSYKEGIDEFPTTYSSVQKINKYLKEVVGPVVMNSEYITTLHKSDTYMNQGRPFGNDELVAFNSTGVIKDVNNSNILLALYQKPAINSTEYYIWVVNKDLDSHAYSTALSLEGSFTKSFISPTVDSYVSPNNSFVAIPRNYNTFNNTTTINIPELSPGEGVMIKVIRRELVPIDGPFANKNAVVLESEKSNIIDSFKIYPNPAKDFLNIQTDDEIISITIYSKSGQIVKNIKTNSKKLDISNIPSGIYVLQVETKNGNLTENFSKK